ncbi:MAG TPA: penicillin-binding protein 2 [Gammaproteobacteria bacterium]|jgi:cell division protein FtsI (penicillin-binding protein 3)|nr:penicillin-binding protein 2 [Gammaproteobacteria bacterium]HIK71926.1 penicillin-binding protein 2 [Gammaproteobacteria bacterium]
MPPSRVALFSGRMLFIRLLFIGAFLLLAGRLLFLQIYQDNFLDEQVLSRSHSEYALLASRGKILDRNNNILALDVRSFSVGVDIKKFKGEPADIESLEKILDLKKGTIDKLIRNIGYKEIKRHVSGAARKKIENFNLEGIFFRENLRRSYPQKEVSSHVVGITDIDRIGIQGSELVFNNSLKGKKGRFIGIKSSGNKKIEGDRVEPQDGKDLFLTIDIRLQSIAFEELKNAIDQAGAESGSVVIINPQSAEILALSNYPSFDPSNRRDIKDHSVFRNRATIDVFEPGSVIKPIAMSAIIDSKKINLEDNINTSPGWVKVSGYKTSDFKDYGVLSLSEIIALSSNVGMVKLCADQDIVHLTKYFKSFGIGRYPVNLLIPAREGFLAHPSEFTLRDKVSSCYGYGLSMSAIQIAQAYSVFANEGIFKELTLFLDDSISSNSFEERVISIETASIVRDMLIKTVNMPSGTARNAKIKGTIVAGKTGTAIENSKDLSYTVTFAGFVPAIDPELLAVVVLHGLEGEDHSGGRVAAPVFSKIVSQSLHVLQAGN